jgi:cytochrome b561
VTSKAVPQDPIRRYSNVAVAFHWVSAALVLTQLVLGFTFAEFIVKGRTHTEILAWHKALGAAILILTLFRLGYRLKNPAPPFPTELPRWRRVAAEWNQRLFYFMLIVLPVTGLLLVSGRSKDGTTSFIGGSKIPVVPRISKPLGEISGTAHVVLVYTTIALLLLHIGAALYQQFVEHDRTAARMPPFQAPDGQAALVRQGSQA